MAMNRNTTAIRFCAALFSIVCLYAAPARAGDAQGVQRMAVLYCGESDTKDVSVWSPGVDVGQPREFSDSCYLIRHGKGWMLWESGISDTVADKPDGVVVGGGILTLRVRKTLQSQLRELGIAPTDIKYLGFSHFHGDHVGNANLFTEATLYIQQAEYDAAFGPEPAKFNFNPVLYEKLRAVPIVRLQGDHDVFGDGSVTIYSTPGHTPGHQSLLVRLPKTGPVLLSGDAVHFRENWESRRVPARNFNQEQSLASMEKLAAILEREHATLWINHDKPQTDTLPHAPEFVE
ncbi:MAG: N-acyl homoserine lactonase family protein [Betaproteobacteria bacterium]|nr:N-acyl homoserine lactonase family protein [Betaproteobacteria bacterium]